MVAIGSQQPILSKPSADPVVRRLGYGYVQFTVNDALKLVEQGFLPEDSTIELLDGALVYRDRFDLRGSEIVHGGGHNEVLSELTGLASRIDSEKRHLRIQSTLVCGENQAPIPDAFVRAGSRSDARGKYPNAADVFSVIEVADSSYERDAGPKLEAYARAGIPQYIIINLRNRTAEVYTLTGQEAGTYCNPQICQANQTIAIKVGLAETFEIPLTAILP